MWAALLPLVLWLAVIAACVYEDGMNLFQWMGCFSRALERPFSVRWTAHTLKFMMEAYFSMDAVLRFTTLAARIADRAKSTEVPSGAIRRN